MFASEIIEWAVATGHITKNDGTWNLSRQMDDVPESLVEAIRSRVLRLPAGERGLLGVASVLGKTFDAKVIAYVANDDLIAVLEGLDGLCHSTDLIAGSGALFEFRHDLFREIIGKDLPEAIRKRFHGRAAEYYELFGPNQNNALLADHYFRAEEWEKAARHSLAAGIEFLSQDAPLEASHFFQRAITFLPDVRENYPDIMAAREGWGDAQILLGRFAKVAPGYSRALAFVTRYNDIARLSRKMAEGWLIQGKDETTIRNARDLLRAIDLNENVELQEKGEIQSVLAGTFDTEGDFEMAASFSLQAQDFFRQAGEVDKLVWEMSNSIFYHICGGDFSRARGQLDDLISAEAQAKSPNVQASAQYIIGLILQDSGRYEKSIPVLDKTIDTSMKMGYYEKVAFANYRRALCHDMLGNINQARVDISCALEMAVTSGNDHTIAQVKLLLAHFIMEGAGSK